MDGPRSWSWQRCKARLGLASGIVWAGPVFDQSGYGNVSRNYVRGLDALGVPLRVVNRGRHSDDVLPKRVVRRLNALRKASAGPHPLLIVHNVPDVFPEITLPEAVGRVGITIFETDRIPQHWVAPCNAMDAIWVPSEFNRETFSATGVDRSKLDVIPYSVDTSYFAPTSAKLPVPGLKGFTFLYVSYFDWRKGFDLLLEAYLREFSSRDDVSLVIRTHFIHGQEGAAVRERLLSLVADRVDLSRPDLPHLELLTASLHQDELRALYNTCDLYISTDRANGWGMPCMEAMAMGKPAATIDWSGSTQFMKEGNSLLIHPTGRLEPVDSRLQTERSELYAGHRWAEVEVGEVRRVMRHAFEKRDELATVAARGMEHVRGELDLITVAARLGSAAERVRGRLVE